MHGAAASGAAPIAQSHDFRQQDANGFIHAGAKPGLSPGSPQRVRTLRQRGRHNLGEILVVRPVRARDVVGPAERERGAHRDAFLADAGVHRPVHQVLVLQLKECLLELPHQEEGLRHPAETFGWLGPRVFLPSLQPGNQGFPLYRAELHRVPPVGEAPPAPTAPAPRYTALRLTKNSRPLRSFSGSPAPESFQPPNGSEGSL